MKMIWAKINNLEVFLYYKLFIILEVYESDKLENELSKIK